jgi:DNA polymerase III subunit delta'
MSETAVTVGPGSQLALPWLAPALAAAVRVPGHALVLHAAPGQGALHWGLALAQAALCDAPPSEGMACGECASCRLVQARSHPDLRVLMPEAQAVALGWQESPGEKRRPSKQLRIEELRGLTDWAHMSSSRGRGKQALIFQAEAMNEHAANALLKTLEEPAPGTRLVLTAAEPARLLPTVRSRCQVVAMPPIAAALALPWLRQQGIADDAQARSLLAATAGQPLAVAQWRGLGIDAAAWQRLPAAMLQGDSASFSGWPLPLVVDALQKLCVDAMRLRSGATATYFASESPGVARLAQADVAALTEWWAALQRSARHAEHPWSEPLRVESLVQQAAVALRPAKPAKSGTPLSPGAWLNSKA